MYKLAVCGSLWFFCMATALMAASPFAWTEGHNGEWQLTEKGKPVYTYHAGVQTHPDAPKERARCCYVYPAYTPSGVSPLDDFPKDHWHHRGIHWAWPVVEANGKSNDHWLIDGIRNVTDAPVRVDVKNNMAVLHASSQWITDAGEKLVQEHVTITANPTMGKARELDFQITLEALSAPVTIRGTRTEGKSYGGFNARFAPRENTMIRTNKGLLEKENDDFTNYEWAEMEATYQGRRAALRIAADPKNLYAPHQWCLRHYGYIGASFPGKTKDVDGYTLSPGKPLTLRFRVQLRDVD